MSRRLAIFCCLLWVSLDVGADPTKPAANAVVKTQEQNAKQPEKPVLEAIISKRDILIAVIDGILTTESFASDTLRVHAISRHQVDVEYAINGMWKRETLTLSSATFTKKRQLK
ncbi:hypothetical protein DRW07_15635 [Alteromonas sediminis]|uniref:Uncharacterized protein n=1 Tax=Alteromonas sediminis TaxID=2259342 RepID=A0A3N5Y9K9_9ALTE|nr:hypothetical protein [Alteromonas sediminis]RPJ65335.1 hypothetical protein DRW07_15635 [Alteromonas sediminis]